MIEDKSILSAEESPSNAKAKKKTLCGILRQRRSRVGCLSAPAEDFDVSNDSLRHDSTRGGLKVCCASPVTSVIRVKPCSESAKDAISDKNSMISYTEASLNGNTNLTLCCAMTESSMSSVYQQTVVNRRKTGDFKDSKSDNDDVEYHRPLTSDVGLQVFEELLNNDSQETNSVDSNQNHGAETGIDRHNKTSESSSGPCSPIQIRKESVFSSGPNLFQKLRNDNKRYSSNDGTSSSFDEDRGSKTAPGSLTRSQATPASRTLQGDPRPPLTPVHNAVIHARLRRHLLPQCHSADNLIPPSSSQSSPMFHRNVPETLQNRKKRSSSHDQMLLGARGRPLSICGDMDLSRPSVSNIDFIHRDISGSGGKSFGTSMENLARQSLLAAQLLHLIPANKARERNFLHGRIAANSLLGSVELERVLPTRQVQIFVGTWNMNGQAPPSELNDLLLPEGLEHIPDIMAVGTQESFPERLEWEVGIQETIGPSHVLLHSAVLGTLHLALFVRRDLIWFCSVPEEANFSVRPGTAFRTKGAVAIAFMLFGTSFLFITSHLTAHAEKVKERLSDVKKIIRSLDLPKLLPCRHKNKDVTQNFDCVFWCGDLNFRLSQPRNEVVQWVSQQQFPLVSPHALEMDQLTNSIAQGAIFRGFEEGPITFKPTYKYDPGTQEFDTSQKQRTPAYTDRILFKCRHHVSRRSSSLVGGITAAAGLGHSSHATPHSPFLECLMYGSVQSVCTSDHKPVWGLYRSNVRPGIDTIPLAAGLFNREVYLEGIKRRAAAMDKRDGASTVCTLQ